MVMLYIDPAFMNYMYEHKQARNVQGKNLTSENELPSTQYFVFCICFPQQQNFDINVSNWKSATITAYLRNKL